MQLRAGSQLGLYEILAPLGAGGMGEVYRARDTRLNRFVALKVLPAAAVRDGEMRERFAREAQALAALNQPGIVTIYSVEDAGETTFLTMELIEGRPLSSVIPPNGLPLTRVLAVAASVIDAVAAAHQKGILHRDLKPANVMIGEGEHQGRVKVLDFGLAKLIAPDAESANAETMAPDTGDGRILGTVSYMSPEQAEGRSIDARSDIFSLGVMLYEMATGQRPFRGGSNITILSSIIKDAPAPVTEINPALPRDFDRIVRRALAKDPERRYQTAKDFRNDLEELKASIESGPALPAPAVAPPTARIWPWIAIAVVALAAAGIAWSMLGRPWGPAATPASALTMTPLTSTGTAILPVLSPDGKYVVYVDTADNEQSVWVRQIASGGTTRIVAPEKGVGILGLTVTPDGSFVDFVRGGVSGELWRVPFLGGPGKKIVDRVSTAPGWSSDGRQMAYVVSLPDNKTTELVVADANGEHARVVATRVLPLRFLALRYSTRPDARPIWLPDGRSIAVLGNTPGREVRVVGVDLATGRQATLYDSPRGNGVPDLRMGFALGADGHSFILNLQTEEGAAQLVSVKLPGGALTRLTNDLAMYFGASRAGDAIATSRFERRSSLWVADAAGHGARQIGRDMPTGLTGLAWAGTRLLYAASLAGGAGVWSTDIASGTSQLVVPTAAWARISTTADGRTLFLGHPVNEIWKSGTDGSHAEKVSPLNSTEAVVAPDGSALFFISLVSGQQVPMVIDLAGGAPRQFSAMMALHGSMSVSPDGRLVTFRSDSGREEEQVILPATGGAPVHRFKLPGSSPHWTPDGQGLAYVDSTGLAIWIQPIAGGAPRQLVSFPDRPILQFAWSPDGQQLAVSRAMTVSDVVLLRGVKP